MKKLKKIIAVEQERREANAREDIKRFKNMLSTDQVPPSLGKTGAKSPRKRVNSPRKRVKSPQKRTTSPLKRAKSPQKRLGSPQKNTKSLQTPAESPEKREE